MTTAMPPPPPIDATAAATNNLPSTSESTETTEMDLPPPGNPNPSEPESSGNQQSEPESNPATSDTTGNNAQLSNSTGSSNNSDSADAEKKHDQRNRNRNAVVPYTIPPWSGPPSHEFSIEVLKDGAIVDQFDVSKKGAYMFGRVDLCDFVLEHPTISRFHAVIQFKSNGGSYLYDLGSTHGTSINKNQVKPRVYVDLRVGDVIRFGQSSRLYIFQGPSELMPPEADLNRLRKAKIRQEEQDMEASLRRAKVEASRADGISWGMVEDAVEENEEDVEEITWQTYKGLLTEKQEKTRDKVIKRLEKIAHMKKEIDAIRVKDIPQGGLTQGQQTQIARNEQRTAQLLEELENLEETLNESIRESLGARGGKPSRGKKKGAVEEEEEDYISDDDDFYDRTQKSLKQKSGENKSVETADSLLEKKEALAKRIEDKEKLILLEDKPAEIKEAAADTRDALDAYMSVVSSKLVSDTKEKLQKEKSTLQSELDRILYLLRIADPAGEAARKREFKLQNPEPIEKKKPSSDQEEITLTSLKRQNLVLKGPSVKSSREKEKTTVDAKSEMASDASKEEDLKSINDESKSTSVYTVAKPQWLGAVDDMQSQKPQKKEMKVVAADLPEDMDQFVDYKDREKILNKTESLLGDEGIEGAAPGLIIRKRKKVEESKSGIEAEDSDNGGGFKAEDAVALLLKHSRGFHALEEDVVSGEDVVVIEDEGKSKGVKKAKRVLGPERPSFVGEPEESTWVPPEGQSGDGRTSLNDRFGY